MNRSIRLFRILCGLLLLVASCGAQEPAGERTSEDDSSGPLRLTISSSSTSVSAGQSVTLSVSAENVGDATLDLGSGSSSCRLGAFAILDGDEVRLAEERPCTMDLSPFVLEKGQRTSESWTWTGDVFVDGERRTLQPGTYDIQGAAGSHRSAPLRIEIVH